MNKEINFIYGVDILHINISFVFKIIEAVENNDTNKLNTLFDKLEKELFDIDEGELGRYLQVLRGICPTFSPQ